MNGITLYEKMDNPNLLANIKELGKSIAKAGLFGIRTDEQGAVMMMTCMAENMTPMEFGRTYHIVKGRLSMRADAMQAKFQESGGRIEWIHSDEQFCEAKFTHRDYAPQGTIIKVTLKELVDSGVTKDTDGPVKEVYKKHPRQMLRARVISEGVRMVNPSIVAGYYTPEEESDIEDRTPRNKSPLLPPRKNREDSKEPKEAEARVVDDAVDIKETADAFLEKNEAVINPYLEHLKWLDPGQTWRDVKPEHRKTIEARLPNFIKKAKEHAEQETANV